MNNRIQNAEGDYTFTRITEPFNGDVIKLDVRSFNLLFQTYTTNGCPYKFVEKIEGYDEWFKPKGMKAYRDNKWLTHITRWLERDKKKYLEREE